MADEAKDTQADAEKAAPETTVEKTETIAEILDTVEKPKEDSTKQVPEAAFLQEKKARKAAEKALKDFQKSIEDGATSGEAASDIDELSEKFDVNKDFLKAWEKRIRAEARRESADEVTERLKPLQEKEKEARIDTAFRGAYKAAIANMPEFDGIANPEVIKTLSLDPKNANKTFSQLIEDTYGAILTGKRTIETTKPGGGKEPETLDFDKARRDSAYFNQIMDIPKLKAEYNERMLKKGF